MILSPLSPTLYLVTCAGLLALGVWAADAADAHFGSHDDGRIVVDEVVGQLLTWLPLLMLPVSAGGGVGVRGAGWLSLATFFWVVTGFVLFRVLDIWKPGPVRWAERSLRGGLGVMMDDVVAGVLAGLALAALLALRLWWVGV